MEWVLRNGVWAQRPFPSLSCTDRQGSLRLPLSLTLCCSQIRRPWRTSDPLSQTSDPKPSGLSVLFAFAFDSAPHRVTETGLKVWTE